MSRIHKDKVKNLKFPEQPIPPPSPRCGIQFKKLGKPVREICKLGNINCFDKFCKLSKKKRLIRRKKNTLLKIAAPSLTSAGSFEVVLSNKDESDIGQLFMRSLNQTI